LHRLGIDVSHWQPTINWDAARKNGIEFAFIKATQGVDIIDDKFKLHWGNSKAAEMPRGAYHFYDPRVPPINQAVLLLKACKEPGERGFVLDAEALKTRIPTRIPANYSDSLYLFCQFIESETGILPIIYTGYYFWTANCPNATWARKYPLWIANYNNVAPMCPLPWGPDGWEFWQFTDKGKGALYGIGLESKQVDLDVWRTR